MAYTVAQYKQIRTKKRNKYNSNKKEYNGIYYHSAFEAKYAQELDWRKKAGEIESWERQVKISLDVNGKHITNYFIDFKVYYPDGSIEYVEVKGFQTPEWILKWKLFEAIFNKEFPEAILTIIK